MLPYSPHHGYRTRFSHRRDAGWRYENQDWFERKLFSKCGCYFCNEFVYWYGCRYKGHEDCLTSFYPCKRGYDKRRWQVDRQAQRRFKRELEYAE